MIEGRILGADELVTVGGRLGRVVSYRMTERGQFCRIRLYADAKPRPSEFPPGGEYVELLASSSKISRLNAAESVA